MKNKQQDAEQNSFKDRASKHLDRELAAIGPIDGRYRKEVEELAPVFSETGLMRYRVVVEGEYLIALMGLKELGLKAFSEEEKKMIRGLYQFSEEDARIVKAIELTGYKEIKATDHDLKAVEYFMKEKLKETALADRLEWIHFALTSEDTNNLAYALMLSDALAQVILPVLEEVLERIEELARGYRGLPLLARTHGQPASPTTFGKEFKVFAVRLRRQIEQLKARPILAKLNGATGNYNAHTAAFAEVDWIKFSEQLVNSFNELDSFGAGANQSQRLIRLAPNLVTTQIEPHDTYAELFDNMRRINMILIDFCQDVWRYISDGWLAQTAVEGEVGSSTMPHKINPWKFENGEGNLGMANAMFDFFSRKLPVSRLQRDLSDSTVERNFGPALAHALIGYRYILKGLSRVTVNEEQIKKDLEKHPEVIAEAIQTVLRSEGAAVPYEQLKEFTRGREVTAKDWEQFIGELEMTGAGKEKLKKIAPAKYIGLADKIAEGA